MLYEREEHRRLLIFGERSVFPVFDDAQDFGPLSSPILEVAVNGLVHRSKHLLCKVAIDDRHLGGLFVIGHGEVSARGAGGMLQIIDY